jgi:hypothetical protein
LCRRAAAAIETKLGKDGVPGDRNYRLFINWWHFIKIRQDRKPDAHT